MHLFFLKLCARPLGCRLSSADVDKQLELDRELRRGRLGGGSGVLVMRAAPCRACGGNVVPESRLRSWHWQGSESGNEELT